MVRFEDKKVGQIYDPLLIFEVLAGAPPRNFDWGDGLRLGGRIQVSQNPDSGFSSDFAHFILEILKNLKILANIQKFSLKIYGGHPFQNFEPGDTSPHPPPGGDAYGS